VRVVADENIAEARNAFAQFGEVTLCHGRDISADTVRNADALIVRSITTVDASLLDSSAVTFVGTATIGTDHVDADYLSEHRIGFATAAGAAARSVAEYVVAALLQLERSGVIEPGTDVVGVIGVGAIGSRIARFVRLLGYRTLERDPPRDEREEAFKTASPEQVSNASVVVFAVPLTHELPHRTHHYFDAEFIRSMNRPPIVVNVARGAVVKTTDLLEALSTGSVRSLILDVWEAEPDVPRDLIANATIATPHVAGYSRDGKLKGTEMMAQALADHFGLPNTWTVDDVLGSPAGLIDLSSRSGRTAVWSAVEKACDIMADDRALRSVMDLSDTERRKAFDGLRKSYRIRREFPAWNVINADEESARILKGLGFRLIS
jgi:erythronate-4-phosphate dehydrogenase